MALKVGVAPKSTRNPYFEDCHRGAEEAAKELGFTLLWEGPESTDAGRQADILDGWRANGVRVMAVSVESSARLTSVMKQARAEGAKVLTWDSDGAPDARDFTVVHATPRGVAHALSFEIGRILGGKGRFAVITSTLTAPNQSAWLREFQARVGAEYPGLELVKVATCNDNAANARIEALELMSAWPGLKAIVGLCSPAVPAAAEAVKEARRSDVRVMGVSLPSLCRSHIDEGVVESVVIWKTRDLGYLVGWSAHALATGVLQRGAASFRAGRLGTVVVVNDEIRLGRCHIVTRGNLGAFV